MKVRIDAGGRVVEIERADVNVSPKDLAEQARSLWEATDGATRPTEPAYGFTASGATVQHPDRVASMRRGEPIPVRAMGMEGT